MQPRMKNPAFCLPDVTPTLMGLGEALRAHRGEGLPKTIVHLVHLRASQINGCSFCVNMHAHEAIEDGDTTQRVFAVGAWREAPWFTAAERAALDLTEALTRLADQSDPVPDALWGRCREHFEEKDLAALILEIATVNLWNRLNAATRQVAGPWK